MSITTAMEIPRRTPENREGGLTLFEELDKRAAEIERPWSQVPHERAFAEQVEAGIRRAHEIRSTVFRTALGRFYASAGNLVRRIFGRR